MDRLVGQDELMQLAGLRQKAALRRHLRKAGIPFREVGGRLFTTEEAITATLVGRGKKEQGIDLDALTAKGAG